MIKFRKIAQALSSLKSEWKEKMKEMEVEGFADKENINRHIEAIKYQNLEFLKSFGPFTTCERRAKLYKGNQRIKNKK